MCDKLPYNNPRIDKCMREIVEKINKEGRYKTLASCCGHNKYPKTIIVKDKLTGDILEYFSKTPLQVKKRNRYYKKDEEGFYFIPELKLKICIICKKPITEEEIVPYCDDVGIIGLHKECKKKVIDAEWQDSWSCALFFIKTDKIHCIKCATELNHKNISDPFNDEDRISVKCHNCNLEFTIWHGGPDEWDYYDLNNIKRFEQFKKQADAEKHELPLPRTLEEKIKG